jgi:hypothetical protein
VARLSQSPGAQQTQSHVIFLGTATEHDMVLAPCAALVWMINSRQMAERTNKYLEYLDKEMTIMGILSTFCVAAVALVLDRIGSADLDKRTLFTLLWRDQRLFVLLGSACVALAATFFYQQRSALAWFYGQISLSIESPSINRIGTDDWYRDADSWATWIPYQSAFTALTIGIAFYAYSLITAAALLKIPVWLLWLAIVVGVAIQGGRLLIYRHYKYDEDPIEHFLSMLRGK